MKKIITVILLIAGIPQFGFAQQKAKGYQVIIDNLGRHVYELWYTKVLEGNVTVYRLYNQNDALFSQVEARHLKSSKQIGVLVYCQTDQGTFYEANFEKCSYNEPSLKQFDNGKNFPLINGKDIPLQLSLQFTDNSYENVKVISVLALRPSISTYLFYVFPKELNNNKEVKNDILFQGTKIFVDKDQDWKNVVTIDKNTFTIKSYPGKNNNHYKNKNIPQSTEIGYIKNGKIYTKSANKTYLPDLYKYESGKLFQLNNENEYNDYFEINNLNGSSLTSGNIESDSGASKEAIPERKFIKLMTPSDDGQKAGKVAMQISINREGVVVDAIPGAKGTTLNDPELWKKCKDAVMVSRLTPSESAPEVQVGVVVFYFKIK